MSQVDWTLFPSGLSSSQVDRGVTNGFTPPSGGGSWVYGWHSLSADAGACGKYYNRANFAPMAKGGSVRGALKRVAELNACNFLFCSLQDPDVGGSGYLLGLSYTENPSRIVLLKGTPALGLNHASAIALSSAAFSPDAWLHLRLDVIRQPSDDVWLRVYRNDLTAHTVSAPVWVLEPGLELFVDDALGINSGTQPYLGGYAGTGYYTRSLGRYAFVDYLEIFRQL